MLPRKRNKKILHLIKPLLLLCSLFFCGLLLLNAKPAEAKEQTYPKTGYINTDTTVKITNRPSKKAKTVCKVKPNTKIKYKKLNSKWAAVKYKKKTGYLPMSYITKHKRPKCRYTPSYFSKAGILHYGGWTWTWYSQNVLPGGGLRIPGRHVDNKGYVCDKYNYICLASSDLPYGTVVSTPFGKYGRVYDSGCSSGILDVYVAW